jgi:hypothetical protein
MALLQLAENSYTALAEDSAISKYIFIPAGMFDQVEDTYVREDFFDGLSDDEYLEVITALAPYQNTGMSAVGAIATAVTTGAKAIGPIVKKAVNKRKERVASGTANPIIKPGSKLAGLKDKVVGALNKLKSGTDTEKKTPISITGSVGDTNVDFTTGQPTDIPFFTKYKTPLLIGGGLLGAFLLYKVLKK